MERTAHRNGSDRFAKRFEGLNIGGVMASTPATRPTASPAVPTLVRKPATATNGASVVKTTRPLREEDVLDTILSCRGGLSEAELKQRLEKQRFNVRQAQLETMLESLEDKRRIEYSDLGGKSVWRKRL